MKNISDFKTDLEFGEFAEETIGRYFKEGSFELKRDRVLHETGRVYIEYESRGKRSGIAQDEVEPVWIYMCEDLSFGLLMSADRLRETIRRFKKECESGLIDEPCTWNKEGGDEDSSKGALINVSDLARIMLEIANEKAT
jgi:hypothetical protein